MPRVTVRGRIGTTDLEVGEVVTVELTARVGAMIDAGLVEILGEVLVDELESDSVPPESPNAAEFAERASLSGSGEIHEADNGGSQALGAGGQRDAESVDTGTNDRGAGRRNGSRRD